MGASDAVLRARMAAIYQEECGVDEGFEQILGSFEAGADSPAAPEHHGNGFADMHEILTLATFRRFLDGGMRCPEGSPGRVLHERVAKIRAISSAPSFLEAWHLYQAEFVRLLQRAMMLIGIINGQVPQGAEPSREAIAGIRDILQHLQKVFSATEGFRRDVPSPELAWAHEFVYLQIAKLGNFMVTIRGFLDGSAALTPPPFVSVGRLLCTMGDCLDISNHVHHAFGIDTASSKRWVDVENRLPQQDRDLMALDPVVLRRVIGEIIYRAGLERSDEKQLAHILIRWTGREGHALQFIDTGRDAEAFRAYRDASGEAVRQLKALAGQLGTGASVHVHTIAGRTRALHIVLPRAQTPAPEGGGAVGEFPRDGSVPGSGAASGPRAVAGMNIRHPTTHDVMRRRTIVGTNGSFPGLLAPGRKVPGLAINPWAQPSGRGAATFLFGTSFFLPGFLAGIRSAPLVMSPR